MSFEEMQSILQGILLSQQQLQLSHRPTILRLLNSNNNKLDAILDRLPPQQ
jgi:hypothetical protein